MWVYRVCLVFCIALGDNNMHLAMFPSVLDPPATTESEQSASGPWEVLSERMATVRPKQMKKRGRNRLRGRSGQRRVETCTVSERLRYAGRGVFVPAPPRCGFGCLARWIGVWHWGLGGRGEGSCEYSECE